MRKTIILLGLMATAVILAGCQSSVTGTVFLDKNGNGEMNSGESGIPFAKLMVTRDSKLVAEQYADKAGLFNVPVKAKSGYLCVETDLSFAEANFAYVMQSLGQEVSAQVPKAVTTSTSDSDGDGIIDTADNCPYDVNTDQLDTDGDDIGDLCDDDEDEESEEETTTTTTTTEPDGWSGSKYCRNVKFKGFEVDIPVSMNFSKVLAEMPKRLKIECYAGETCVVKIPYPQGCVLDPLNLPEGVTLDQSATQTGVDSYDQIFNIVNFSEATTSSEKAQTSGPSLSASGFTMVTLNLAVDEDIEIGTTEVKLEPSAECYEQELEMEAIPIDLIRDVSVAVYQSLTTPIPSSGMLAAGSNAQVKVLVENRGHSAVSKGDLRFSPPAGSVIQAPAGCLNYGTFVLCRAETIDPGEIFFKDITFKLPSPAADEEVICEASFSADGLDEDELAESVSFKIDGTT